MRWGLVAALGAALALLTPATAQAAFPFGQKDGDVYKLPGGANQAPNDVGGKELKFAATPEPGNEGVNNNPYELDGVRGPSTVDNADVDQAWRTTTGRPDVTIATLDSGIEWNNLGAMEDLRRKTRINRGEAPEPETGRTSSLETGQDCADFDGAGYDKNEDGVFNVIDYACDSRVEADSSAEGGDGPTYPSTHPTSAGKPMLEPQDVLIAFTDGDDDDSNGYEDDMVGWDFLDDDNDPFDDVQYGHGTGEAEDGFGEANNALTFPDPGDPNENITTGGATSHCPNCMGIHMRVGDSFIADVNNFAEATLYAADNDVEVVQEALGTLNHSHLGLQAVEYAYDHGVTIIASAADEAAQHHNWPSSYPHVVMVNSVTQYDDGTTPPAPSPGRSYLQFNGCTNFMSNVTLAIPSTSCSSDAVGQSSGMAGLIYSAAYNAHDRASNPLPNHPTCDRTNGDPCVISANEVRQILASGTLDGQLQADDVDFLSTPPRTGDDGPGCTPPTPGCTDPNNAAEKGLILTHRPLSILVPPNSTSYPARKGHDAFYGYGRVNTNKAVDALDAKKIPPEVEIRSPVNWWDQFDPADESLDVRGQVGVREGSFTCQVFVAPGSYPDNDTGDDGDFKPVTDASAPCNGTTTHGDPLDGRLATVTMQQLKGLFPPDAGDFTGREPGTGTQTSNGRPNTEPYGFTIKVVATGNVGGAAVTGEDRRNEYLHRDQDQLEGFPKKLPADGGASPLLVDLDGDNRTELVMATSDGEVHAYQRDGSELPGWPVRSDALSIPGGQHGLGANGAILASPAAADLDQDGAPEVVAADMEGKLYAWNTAGERLFQRESEIKFSGKPLTAFADVRKGHKYRTQHGFLSSPVLADLDRDDGGRLEIIAASMDRHVYAWNHDGSAVDGYPVLVADYSKLADAPGRADGTTHALNFKADVGDLNQGAIVNTPAVGDLDNDPDDQGEDEKPEIVVGTNEEYTPDQGGEPPLELNDLSAFNAAATLLEPANSRVYALKPEGDPGGPNQGDAPFVGGWPQRLAFLLAEILPVVGEGVTGSPVIGEVNCQEGGEGAKVGAQSAAGPVYVMNKDGSSCYGTEGGRKKPLATEGAASPKVTDQPSIPAFGQPMFGEMEDATGPSVFAPSAGIIRALDATFNEYQEGGQDQLSGWNAQTGQFRPNYPVQMNDLQFLAGPALADIDDLPGQEIVNGSASLDLQAYNAAGLPPNTSWPKLTSDWIVSTPAIGGFGELATGADARKTVVALTRSGLVHAYETDAPPCSPASWPKFHHDNANSGDIRRDASAPGRPFDGSLAGSELSFKAPGDDLLCGQAENYEAVTSDQPITGSNFADADPIQGAPAPGDPGSAQTLTLPAGVKRFVGLRARDDQGNLGRPLVMDRAQPGGGGAGQGAQGVVPGLLFGGGVFGGPTGGGCARATGSLRGTRLGPFRLGQRRSSVDNSSGYRRLDHNSDQVCLSDGGSIVVGYATASLVRRTLGSARTAQRRRRPLWRRLRGRAVLLLTTNRRYRARGLRVGSRARKLRRLRRHRIGRGLWYVRRGRGANLVFGVRRGRIRAIGIADRRLTRTRRASRRFLRAF